MKTVYDILRHLRVLKKLNQQNLADDLGLSLTGYAKIERGETDISFSRLERIAAYYEITVLELLQLGTETQDDKNSINEKDKEIEYLKEINKLLRDKITNLEKNLKP